MVKAPPVDVLLHQLLARAAARRPGAIAAVDGSRTITYAALDSRADQIAQLLHENRVRRGDRVALYLDKSLESLVAIYGILKAGAAYVPLDPHAPLPRLAFMAANCGIECVLTSATKQGSWSGLLEQGAPIRLFVTLDETTDTRAVAGVATLGPDAIDRQATTWPGAGPVSLDDLAYVLYTSGSTGTPKGVMLTHRNATEFVGWAVEQFSVNGSDRLASHAPLHFDLSVFDLFATAAAGATVVLVPPRTSLFPLEVARLVAEAGITVWYSVPSALTMLTVRGGLRRGDLPSLRAVLFAGEVFPPKYLRELMHLLPDARFANLYGPTETNVCTWWMVPEPPTGEEKIPIGRAIANDEVLVVTDDWRRADRGEIGELCVRGDTVMRGYWAAPELTARALVPPPRDDRDPADARRVYRTGDIGYQEGDGTFHFLGRRDTQIKSRGYRIELGEIEAALCAHPSVVECAVVAIADDLVTNRIKAFVVTRDDVDGHELTRFCAGRIAPYMLPETFEFPDQLARTSTGKIDRQALLV